MTYKLSARYIYLCFFGMQILFTDYFYLKKSSYTCTQSCAHFDLSKNQYFCEGHKPKLIISSRNCENDTTSNKPFNRYGSNLLIMLYNRKNY